MVVGTSLPGVQQIPARVSPWERTLEGADLIAAARAAEAAGLGWVSCSDHVLVPASRTVAMGGTWYDAGSTLAFVAGATARIGLLSHVLVLPYRHPLVVAKQYGTLDRLSGGRVILGVGSGHLKPEFAVLGADYERRGAVTDDAIAAIVAAWTAEVASFEGRTLAFRDVVVSPAPAARPRPRIWVGGNSRAAMRRAARHADGWVPWELTPAACADAVGWLRGERAARQRTEPFTVVAPLAVPPGAAAGEVLGAARRWAAAGATALHAGVAARSLSEWLERVSWVGERVLPQLG
jgi:probable F420-dependent oxidoreductase